MFERVQILIDQNMPLKRCRSSAICLVIPSPPHIAPQKRCHQFNSSKHSTMAPKESQDNSPSEPKPTPLRSGLLTLTGIVTFTTLLKIASRRYIGRPVFQGPGLQILERSNGIRIIQTRGRQVYEYPDGRRFVQEGGSQWWEIPKGWRGH